MCFFPFSPHSWLQMWHLAKYSAEKLLKYLVFGCRRVEIIFFFKNIRKLTWYHAGSEVGRHGNPLLCPAMDRFRRRFLTTNHQRWSVSQRSQQTTSQDTRTAVTAWYFRCGLIRWGKAHALHYDAVSWWCSKTCTIPKRVVRCRHFPERQGDARWWTAQIFPPRRRSLGLRVTPIMVAWPISKHNDWAVCLWEVMSTGWAREVIFNCCHCARGPFVLYDAEGARNIQKRENKVILCNPRSCISTAFPTKRINPNDDFLEHSTVFSLLNCILQI